ncbi:phosducin-like protein [Agrilus planipennis]|uniref:Phosducin-like protein n=1 Tax=Agrilus planipennis TaxID=224129 RepID=A0A1W4WT03_AGRPL|nr:phosducin-like protein [Agrilus planipennis]
MTTLDDKILGEKLQYYCSSSEDEENGDSDSNSNTPKKNERSLQIETSQLEKWEGTSQNTGPKGVITDWQRFKQLESEKRNECEKERIALAKKLTLSVQSTLDEEREKSKLEDPEISELLNDEFLLQYQKQRMEEMLKQQNHNVKFGELIFLKNSEEYLDAIEKEHKSVKIIIHIYEKHLKACQIMNSCLAELAKVYDNVKFCAIIASVAGLSRDFKISGVPALLIYKNGILIGNFVRLSYEFGDSFYAEDVQGFLIEHGMLEDKTLVPKIVKSINDQSDDSD